MNCLLCLAGVLLLSWSLIQEVASSYPFTVNTSVLVTEFSEFNENIRENSVVITYVCTYFFEVQERMFLIFTAFQQTGGLYHICSRKQWRIQGGAVGTDQNFLNFMQFVGKSGKFVC